MPIRHCQKCGLKVLIDESQAASSPFYCQRCTTAMKSQEQAAAEGAIAVKPATPLPIKPSTVKVLCPYCKASFNGRVPQKPARGACPVCQKELILLPNGDIRPAAGFDITRWQQEQRGAEAGRAMPSPTPAPAQKETGTKVLIRKYAADAEAAAVSKPDTGTKVLARKQAEATPVPQPPLTVPEDAPAAASGDDSAPLPSWLDEPQSEAAAPVGQRESYAAEEPPQQPESQPIDSAEPSVEEPQSQEPPAPSRPPVAVLPPPPPPPPPMPQPSTARKPIFTAGTRKTDRKPLSSFGAPATGMGKVLLAYLLLAIPIAGCPFLMGQRPKLTGRALEKIGIRFQKGFHELYLRLAPPPPAPKPPTEEKKPEPPPEEKPKAGPEEQKMLRDDMDKLARELQLKEKQLKQDLLVATDAQKAELQKVQDDINKKRDRVNELRAQYKNLFNDDYNPFKEQ